VTAEQRAAFVIAQAVCAMADIAAMQAENQIRIHRGETPAYTEESFTAVQVRYGIDHNAVISLFQD